jgi:hypothetical protein
VSHTPFFGLQDEQVIAKAHQVILLVVGGLQEVGEHVRDLVHVLNQAKVLVFYKMDIFGPIWTQFSSKQLII